MQHWADEGDTGRAAVGDALGVEGFALEHYRLPPGEGLPSGLHTHLDQAETFVVLAGELQFETLDDSVTVEAGEAVRFAPGEYQTGDNGGEEEAVVVAVGAPRESNEVRVPLDCPDCHYRGLSPEWEGEVVLACPDCGADHRTRGCPDCDREELEVTAGDDGGTLVVCPGCGAERTEPAWK